MVKFEETVVFFVFQPLMTEVFKPQKLENGIRPMMSGGKLFMSKKVACSWNLKFRLLQHQDKHSASRSWQKSRWFRAVSNIQYQIRISKFQNFVYRRIMLCRFSSHGKFSFH